MEETRELARKNGDVDTDDMHMFQEMTENVKSPQHQDAARSAGESSRPGTGGEQVLNAVAHALNTPEPEVEVVQVPTLPSGRRGERTWTDPEGPKTANMSSNRIKKYRSPVCLEDPEEIKRQIRFKKHVIQNLREHCDKEIGFLQAEVQNLEKMLEDRRRPLVEKIHHVHLQEQAAVVAWQPERTIDKQDTTWQPNGPKAPWGASLFDQFQLAIKTRRQEQVDTGIASSHEEIEENKRREWWRNRAVVDKKALNAAKWAAVFGMLGCACGMIQNELVLQEVDPTEFRMDLCKCLNSIFTLICLLIIYRYYWLRAVIFRINRHCRRLVRFDANISFGHIASSWVFWLEVLIVGVHCPPFYTNEYWTDSFDNIVVYRIETIAALLNTIRIYLFFRWLRDYELSKMAKRHTIESFAGAKFNNKYICKRWLHGWNASLFLTLVWGLCIFMCAYWYRSAEITACYLKTTKMQEICNHSRSSEWILYAKTFEHTNQYYIWDSLWLMYITTASIGYGDITPKTHMGRFCAGAITVLGMLLGALLIAAMMANLEWTPHELSILRILERAKAKEQVKAHALAKLRNRMKQLLENYRKKKRNASRPQAFGKTGLSGLKMGCFSEFLEAFKFGTPLIIHEGQELTKCLRELQRQVAKDLADLQPDDTKFDRLYRRCRYIGNAVKSIHDRLESRRLEDKKEKTQTPHTFEELYRSSRYASKLQEGATNKPSQEAGHAWLKVQRIRNQIKKLAGGKEVMNLETQREAERAKALRVLNAMRGSLHWSRDKKVLSQNLQLANKVLAFVGCCGTCLSLVQNEMVIMGYGSVLMLDFCKTVNSFCSVFCVLLLCYIYWMTFLLRAVSIVLQLGQPACHALKYERVANQGRIIQMPDQCTLAWLDLLSVYVHKPFFPCPSFCLAGVTRLKTTGVSTHPPVPRTETSSRRNRRHFVGSIFLL